MDLDLREIEADLIDLSGTSLRELSNADPSLLAQSQAAMMEQLKHPRANLGSGPPGRVD